MNTHLKKALVLRRFVLVAWFSIFPLVSQELSSALILRSTGDWMDGKAPLLKRGELSRTAKPTCKPNQKSSCAITVLFLPSYELHRENCGNPSICEKGLDLKAFWEKNVRTDLPTAFLGFLKSLLAPEREEFEGALGDGPRGEEGEVRSGVVFFDAGKWNTESITKIGNRTTPISEIGLAPYDHPRAQGCKEPDSPVYRFAKDLATGLLNTRPGLYCAVLKVNQGRPHFAAPVLLAVPDSESKGKQLFQDLKTTEETLDVKTKEDLNRKTDARVWRELMLVFWEAQRTGKSK